MEKIDSKAIEKYVSDLETANGLAVLITIERKLFSFAEILSEAVQIILKYADVDTSRKFIASYIKKIGKYSDCLPLNSLDKEKFDESLRNLHKFAHSDPTSFTSKNDEKKST